MTPKRLHRGHHAVVTRLEIRYFAPFADGAAADCDWPATCFLLQRKRQETYDYNDSTESEAVGSTKTLVDSKIKR